MNEFRPHNRAHLMGSVVDSTVVKGDFRNGLAFNSTFKAVLFEECRFDRMQMFGSKFYGCFFDRCTLNQTNLNACEFDETVFSHCEMDGATFDASRIYSSHFSKGRAECASFKDAALVDSTFDLQLSRADLRFGKAVNLDYGDSNLWGASVYMACVNFVGAKASDRQLQLLAGLMARTKSGPRTRDGLEMLLNESTIRMLDRLTIQQEAPDGPDTGATAVGGDPEATGPARTGSLPDRVAGHPARARGLHQGFGSAWERTGLSEEGVRGSVGLAEPPVRPGEGIDSPDGSAAGASEWVPREFRSS